MPPLIATGNHLHVLLGALHHKHTGHRGAGAIGQRRIHRGLERHRLVLAEAAISGDHRFHFAVIETVPQGFCGKATEHHRMGSTNARASEHGDRRLRHHRHIERHKITLANAHGLEAIGGFADLGMQFLVGEPAHIPRLSFPDQRCFLSLWPIEMTVQAVVGEVRRTTLKPARKRRIGPIEHGVEGLEPMQFSAGGLTPERIWIVFGGIGHGPVGLEAADASFSGGVCWRLEHPLLLQHAFDGGVGVGHSRLRSASPRRVRSRTPVDPGPVSIRRTMMQSMRKD